uniref:Protein tyrosine phosphatase type IVA 3 n=12 Tax=Neoaves TaxID=3078114 RepID=A0A8C3KC94_9CHAR
MPSGGGGGRVSRAVPISGGRAVPRERRGRGGSGLCARSRLGARGLSGLSAPHRVEPQPQPRHGPRRHRAGPAAPPSAPASSFPSPGPVCGRRRGPFGRTPTRSMPRDWPFDDGAPPPNQIVDDWLNLLKTKFREEPGCCVAVHCVAGLGRAPVLVALALIECGMKYEDAVQFIRQKRRGAFNSKQLLYLEKYRPKMRLRFKDANGHCCVQ